MTHQLTHVVHCVSYTYPYLERNPREERESLVAARRAQQLSI